MIKLKELVKITNGYAFESKDYCNQGARIIRITNVQKGEIVDDNPKYYPFTKLNKLSTFEIHEGDILMSLTGNVGRVGRFPKQMLPAYINQRVCRIKSKTGRLSDDYLFHILNSNEFENRAINSSTGIAQLNLSTKWIEDFQIPLPPLAEQQRIAKILNATDTLRKKTQQIIDSYDELAQSIFLDMFGDPVKNEKGWKKYFLKSVLSKIGSGATPSGGKESYYDEGISLIRSLNVFDNLFKYKDLAFINEFQAKKLDNVTVVENDVLFNITGASVCRCCVVPKDILPARVNQHVAILRPKCDKLNSIFLNHLLISVNVKKQLLGISKQGGATREAITKEQLENFEIAIPNISLQNQFAEKIQLIEKQKELAKQSLKESEDLFNALLQKAFKGELSN